MERVESVKGDERGVRTGQLLTLQQQGAVEHFECGQRKRKTGQWGRTWARPGRVFYLFLFFMHRLSLIPLTFPLLATLQAGESSHR